MLEREKSFTIIELLIVIAIISILVGIALPRFKGMQDEANTAKAKAELRVLQTAIESFYMNSTPNAYPGTTTTICVDDLNGASPLIVANQLYDPFASASTEYYYVLGAAGTYYAVASKGLDGTADIIASEVNDGTLTSGEVNDDIYATNADIP